MSRQATLLRQMRQALQRNHYAEAVDALTQVIALARAADDQDALARHHGNLALIYQRMGDTDAALEHFAYALDHARASGDRAIESGLLGNMGNVLREAGRAEDAIPYLENALALAVDTHDERGRGIWLSNLALVYDDLAQYANAIPLHEQAIVVARTLRDLRGLAARLGHLAQSFLAFGDAPSALIHTQEAVMIDRDLGDKPSLARRLAQVGQLYVVLGQRTTTRGGLVYCYLRAVEQYRQSLATAHEMTDAVMQAENLRIIGELFLHIDDPDQAINHLDAAYQMFEALGIQAPLADLQVSLDHAYAARQAQPITRAI
jgi:tetratricopeptide (TPR) repeat protein